MSKPAHLGIGSVPKGVAVPLPRTIQNQRAPAIASAKPTSLTLKLDAERYKALRQRGVDADKTHQAMLVEALDAYLAKDR
jgi:hypothetical protein